MILCLTPNPGIDRTMYVDELQIGEVHRAKKVLEAAGGKGLNVARAIHTLGGTPLCMGPIGGHTGHLLAQLAQQEGLSAHWTRVKNETRTCVILVQERHDATVINEPGRGLDASECEQLLEDVLREAEGANLVCISGSLPPGFLQEQFRKLLADLVERDKTVWVDTSGDALKTAIAIPGICIKVNCLELGDVLRAKIVDANQAVQAAGSLCKIGIRQMSVTLGNQGAVLVSAPEALIARPPLLKIVSSVGSGDAFLGGLAFALEAGSPPAEALCTAVAAGASNALEVGGGKFSIQQFEGIRKLTVCQHLQSDA